MQLRAFAYTAGAALAMCSCAAAVTTQVTATSNPSTSVYKQNVGLAGQVQTVPLGQGTPLGVVNLLESVTQSGGGTTVTIITTGNLDAQGRFSFAVDSLPAGRHTLSVQYIGSGNFSGSTSANFTQVVNPAPTTTTLTTPTPTSQANQSVAFSASVAHSPPSSGVPSGSVAFFDGSSLMGTVPLPATGPAQFNKTLSLGLHSVSAVFTPSNGNSVTSTSAAVAVSVGNNVTILLASNPPSPGLSQLATLVATVSSTGALPTGTVQFLDGPQNLGSAALSSGQGSLQTSFNTVGGHNITVNYSGDSTYLGNSASFTVNVGKVQTTTDISASTTNLVFGQPVTLTSQIGPPLAGVSAPSGQVTFFDGSTPMGSAVPSSGFALLTLSTVPAGRHTFTAYYAGDANYQPAQSLPLVLNVDVAATLADVTLVNSFAQQATVKARVTVLPPSTGTASGTVQFIDSITKVVLGASALSAGAATATINLQGANPVAALYVGDGNYGASTSIPTSVVFLINAAGTIAPAFAPDELIAIFGSNLARQVIPAPSLPLPTDLGGVTIDVVDSANVSRRASLTYVSPSQVNALLPAGMAFGPATLTLTTGYGLVFPVQVTITPTAPGIFTANSDGRGVPAAIVLRVKPDSSQVFEPAIAFDNATRKWVAVPIDVSSDLVFLQLYGTGIRNIPDASAAPCIVGATQIKPAYAGAQPSFPGLDQVNVLLPASLSGAGTVTVQMTVNGQPANPVTIAIK